MGKVGVIVAVGTTAFSWSDRRMPPSLGCRECRRSVSFMPRAREVRARTPDVAPPQVSTMSRGYRHCLQ